jgi:hypothetical protein
MIAFAHEWWLAPPTDRQVKAAAGGVDQGGPARRDRRRAGGKRSQGLAPDTTGNLFGNPVVVTGPPAMTLLGR